MLASNNYISDHLIVAIIILCIYIDFITTQIYNHCPYITYFYRELNIMNPHCEIPCLGRPFKIGMFYDQRCDRLLYYELQDDITFQYDITTTNKSENIHCEFLNCDTNSFEEKASCFNMQDNLKLSFLVDLVSVSGSASYLYSKTIDINKQVIVVLKISKNHNSYLVNYPEKFISKNIHTATHMVCGISYSTAIIITFLANIKPNEDRKRTKEIMKELVTGIWTSKLKYEKLMQQENKKYLDMLDRISCTIYGDIYTSHTY